VSDSALLATLLREAPIGFALFDPDLRFRRVNRTLARLHGLGHREHLGRLPSEIWPPDVATRVESAVRRVLASDQPVFEADQQIATAVVPEGRTRRSDAQDRAAGTRAEVHHWAFSWFPSHDPGGNITGVVLIAVDVTDRQRSEEAVRRSEERYRSLVRAGAQVVWVTTPTGEVAEDAHEWRAITGQPLD